MSWDEFCDLMSGLDPDTPLGRMVQIRTETDKDILKEYTPGMKKIRNDWLKKSASKKSEDDVNQFLKSMQEVFKSMAGVADETG